VTPLVRLRGFLVLSLLFSCLSLVPLLFVSFFDVLILYNPKPASFINVAIVWLVAGFAFWTILPAFSSLFLLSLSLIVGGANANIFYRMLIGPVPDYIPLPGNLYANLPDLMIFLGSLVFLFLLARTLMRERAIRKREKKEVSLLRSLDDQ
jgi:lipoprotein signal peptidase